MNNAKQDFEVTNASGSDFQGQRIHCSPTNMKTPGGLVICFCRPFGKSGKLLNKNRPGIVLEDGTIELRSQWAY